MRKILVIAPVMPQQSDVAVYLQALSFLQPDYQLNAIDPLSLMDNGLDNSAYFQAWADYLDNHADSYDACIGFSLGGVILQQCFSVLQQRQVPVILLSTPTFADGALKQKLEKVIHWCKNILIEDALYALYSDVFYPHQCPRLDWSGLNQDEAALRLIQGLTRVLTTDARETINTAQVRHLHLIGEQSGLVNRLNVLPPAVGRLITVPGAGMRVLQENLSFCQPLIKDELCTKI